MVTLASVLMVPETAAAAPARALAAEPATSVLSSGWNDFGQLGIGPSRARASYTRIRSLGGATAIGAGLYSGYAVLPDGTVRAWGINTDGGLGDGTTTDRDAPVEVGSLTGVTAVAAADWTGYALRGDGTVWAWGSGFGGELGDGGRGNSLTPVRVGTLTGVTAIAGHRRGGYALKSDGTVWAWGDNGWGQLGDGTFTRRTSPVQVRNLTGVTAIASAAGSYSGYALRSDGTVWAWGGNASGQLGNGSTTDSATPVQVADLTGVTAIAAGSFNGYALRSDSSVWSWGGNTYGQLGDGTTAGSVLPVRVYESSGTTAVFAGGFSAFAKRSDGSVRGWGGNFYGQLGDGTTTNAVLPSEIGALRLARSVVAGYGTAYGLTATKPEPLDVMHYNIAGATKNGGSFPIIGRIVAEVRQRRPDVLSINEICSHQYDHLRGQLTAIGYQMHAIFHAALKVNPTCGGIQEDGNALFVLGEVLQEHRYYFDRLDGNQLKEGQNPSPLAARWQTVACLTTRFSNPGMPVKVCTTHLQSKGQNGDIYAEPRAQAVELARVFGPEAWQRPFILAGDLNLPVNEYGLDQLYNEELLGHGPFGELATTVRHDDEDGASERSGVATHDEGKLDYVFVSREFASDLAATGVVDHTCTGDNLCSDHRMVYGEIERQVPNGYTVHCPHGYTCLFSEPDFGGREVAVKGCEFRDLAEFDFRDVVSSWARNNPADNVSGRAYNAGDGGWFPLWTMGASEAGNVAAPDDNAADAVDPCDDDATP